MTLIRYCEACGSEEYKPFRCPYYGSKSRHKLCPEQCPNNSDVCCLCNKCADEYFGKWMNSDDDFGRFGMCDFVEQKGIKVKYT